MRIGIVGINHKLADLKLREALAKTCQKRFGALQAVHENRHHFVLLSTCNRTEIYFSSTDLAATHTYILSLMRMEVEEEFDHKLYSYFGSDCFLHLARVAAGLDSAVIAETEIQGQVKTAYEAVIDYHSLPSEIHYLFQRSLGIAKKVRTELRLGRGMPNLEQAILQTGKRLFDRPEEAKMLFVGASAINVKILQFIKQKRFLNVTLCNRSESEGHRIKSLFNVNYLEWNRLERWIDYDWIIFGTKSPDFLITGPVAGEAFSRPKLVMDLSVPRNVDPSVGEEPGIELLNIDRLNDSVKMCRRFTDRVLNAAEQSVLTAARRHADRYLEKACSKPESSAAIIA